MNKIAIAPSKERKELFSTTAQKMHTKPSIVEKDFWVVWVLDKIFTDDRLNKKLMFKGGTSLSKVFNLIGRFSEDIDLILDWREVTKENPKDERVSKSQQVKFNKKVNTDAQAYIKDVLLPIVAQIVSPLCSCKIVANEPFNINITYPASFEDVYLRPEILLEIGPLASWLPSENFEISSYASQKFPDVFDRAVCKVNAIVAKRTFWEKATILHQEAHRVKEKALLPRYSRHYYDMAIMAKSDVKNEALSDLELLQQVIDFKNKFYPATWAKFDKAKPNTLKLVPPDFRIAELKKDYKAMEHMIFDKYLTFEEILKTLQALEKRNKLFRSKTMTNKITENEIELFAIELLEKQGYEYIYAPDSAPDSQTPMRESFEDVILKEKLISALTAINPTLDDDLIQYAVKQIERLHSTQLLADNEAFHIMLTEGITVEMQIDGTTRGEIVKLIDFDDISNNDFVVANQFTVVENGINKRPDLILFINGLPLVVVELKNPVDENATIGSAYKQIQTYKSVIPSLFTYNAFCIISDGLEAKAGTISAGLTRFMSWKSSDGKSEASKLISQVETMINAMLNPVTLLDLIRHFIVYEKSTKEDAKTGITTIETVKKLAAYHQYYAVNKAIASTLRAVGDRYGNVVQEAPVNYGLKDAKDQPRGDGKAGVVWHTQGSGKSLSMVFYSGKIVLALNNPTILVITDRNDLDDQLFDTFASSKSLLRQEPIQAEDREHLKKLLKVASGGVIFATIQKFQPDEGNVYDELSTRRNIIVLADEAHRTQYGFKPKTIDVKDKDGNVVGKKIVYGFAKYLRDALPNATYLGFTGTPIEGSDVNTPAVFGDYVDIYDISQAVEDGATVKIYYESRLAKITLSDEGKELVKELDSQLKNDDLSETQKAKSKWTQLEALIGSENRIKEVAKDIVSHLEKRQEVFDGKGMIVSMSRRIAVELYKEIIELKPQWHSDDLTKGVIKVVMTASSSDGPQMAKHHTTKQQRRDLANRMKDVNDELQLVIVRDMWLTGFDVPSLHTLYIDKPMKGHNLMQAIARVNRVYKDKPAGLVVDYLGIASDLKKALSFYSDSGGKGDPALAIEQAVALMLEKLEVVSQMYHGFAYENYFEVDTREKLSLILEAEEHILGLEDGKKRYIDEVTALSQAFAIAVPAEAAMDVKDEISFFQAVKARLVKFEVSGSGRTDEELETTIRQVIDKALVTEQVIDIFDASGIKKPDISILSEEFLVEVAGMKHKNIALEVLKKILNDEIKARSKTNLVQSKSLMEMLENSIKKYHNKIITAAEVIEELINLSKDIKKQDEEPKEMGLTDFEYAFYTAIASNDSAKEVMQKDKLRELAVVLTERIRANTSIDWTIKESVRTKLRVIVKRTLRQFGYPPDMEMLATETVLKQAEMIANELAA